MSAIKTMTLDEARRLPPLTRERAAEIRAFKNEDYTDCPRQTKEELESFRPWYDAHPNGDPTYKVRVTKTQVSLRVDTDVLNRIKSGGPGWQTRVNDYLRKGVASGQL